MIPSKFGMLPARAPSVRPAVAMHPVSERDEGRKAGTLRRSLYPMPRDVQDSCMRMPLGVRFNAQMNYGQRTAKSELEVKHPEKIVRTCQVRKSFCAFCRVST